MSHEWGQILLQRMKPCCVLERNKMVKMLCQSSILFCPGLASSSTVRVFALSTRKGRRSCTTSRTRSTSLSSHPCRVDLITMPSLVWLWHSDRSAQHANAQFQFKSNFVCIDVMLYYPGLLFPNKKLITGETKSYC